MFTVRDMTKSLHWYRDALGFDLETPDSYWAYEDDILWAQVKSGDVRLMFSHETIEEMPISDSTVYYFFPDDIEAIHEDLEKRGYDVSDLRINNQNTLEFDLIDLDNRRLVFMGEPQF
jgi:catechol 2,3-dioxygenase-like lactoylglutathione lyase family enzyme